jgi:hypothetical protein
MASAKKLHLNWEEFEMKEKTEQEKLDAYNRIREGARRGGLAEKHFTPSSKEAQRDGARRGGLAEKHFTPSSKEAQRDGARRGGMAEKHFSQESKDNQINGARRGGQHSHINK